MCCFNDWNAHITICYCASVRCSRTRYLLIEWSILKGNFTPFRALLTFQSVQEVAIEWSRKQPRNIPHYGVHAPLCILMGICYAVINAPYTRISFRVLVLASVHHGQSPTRTWLNNKGRADRFFLVSTEYFLQITDIINIRILEIKTAPSTFSKFPWKPILAQRNIGRQQPVRTCVERSRLAGLGRRKCKSRESG